MISALEGGLLQSSLTGRCPAEFLLGLQAGGFIDEGGEITAQGHKTIDRIIANNRTAAKQARYAAGRQSIYPSKTKNGYGKNRPRPRKFQGAAL